MTKGLFRRNAVSPKETTGAVLSIEGKSLRVQATGVTFCVLTQEKIQVILPGRDVLVEISKWEGGFQIGTTPPVNITSDSPEVSKGVRNFRSWAQIFFGPDKDIRIFA